MLQPVIKRHVTNALASADIKINGERPWDIQVNDEAFYPRVFWHGSLGFGESYMDGMFDSHKLDEMIYHILKSPLGSHYNPFWTVVSRLIPNLLWNQQTRERSLTVGKEHYDTSNRLFELMLDKRMVYSCAYWKDAQNLEQAQEAKLDLICRKLELKPGMRLLDIGCGWGGLAKYAAERYGVSVVGITISQNQLELAQEICAGLPIELRFQDYRDIKETFDRIVSVGQMEHVGYKNYRQYMEIVKESLTDDGLFLLHTIGSNRTIYGADPWIEKYIFPHGMLPSQVQLTKASEKLLVMEDWHNFGADYDKTLMAWYENFNKHWNELEKKYTERFRRMWNYYLLSCASSFRARSIQLWQIVYSKHGVEGGYNSIR